MPTHHDEHLLERYQREHREFEGMMMSEHTDGPIRYDYEPGYCGEFIASNGATVCTFTDEPSPENTRRLVAAWNYCNEHSTDYLEKASATSETAGKTLMADFQRDVDRLSAINAELLEALEDCATYLSGHQTRNIDTDKTALESARAAIAKVQGKQP